MIGLLLREALDRLHVCLNMYLVTSRSACGIQTVVDDERAAFMRLAGDDGEIDAYELQEILNQEFKRRKPLSAYQLISF